MHWIDPASLPAVNGTVTVFTRNRKGDVDGVLLDGDRQVHLPPHLGARLEKLIAVGDSIEARYVKPRGADLFAAVSVQNKAGRTLVDEGPPPPGEHAPHREPPAKKQIEVDGRIRLPLHAPKGEICGAVLESGEQLRVDPKANAHLAAYFSKGAQVRVWGDAFTRKGTVVIEVESIGFSRDF